MSRISRGCGGHGRNSHGGCSQRRGANYTGASTTKHKGLCAALSNHMFNSGQRGPVNDMRITWEKISHHDRTIYEHNISKKLQRQEPADNS
eukprot:9096554-Ditylum_brightwellii.AAC.1